MKRNIIDITLRVYNFFKVKLKEDGGSALTMTSEASI